MRLRAAVVRVLPSVVGLVCMLVYDWTTSAYQLGWMLVAGLAGWGVTVAGIRFYRRRAAPGG